MKCPVCNKDLKEISVADIKVDICEGGCAGIWFDNYELQKVDEKHEAAGTSLLEIEKDKNINIGYETKRNCPKCEGVIMLKHFVSAKREIEIDECANCGGIWLDSGELRQIRDQFKTEEDRKKAGNEYLNEVCGPLLKAAQEKSEAELAKTKKIARMFKFICPTYYIPGEQNWGAF